MKNLETIRLELQAIKVKFDEEIRKPLNKITMELKQVIKDKDINNPMLKFQTNHYWLDSVDRKFKILDEELKNEQV